MEAAYSALSHEDLKKLVKERDIENRTKLTKKVDMVAALVADDKDTAQAKAKAKATDKTVKAQKPKADKAEKHKGAAAKYELLSESDLEALCKHRGVYKRGLASREQFTAALVKSDKEDAPLVKSGKKDGAGAPSTSSGETDDGGDTSDGSDDNLAATVDQLVNDHKSKALKDMCNELGVYKYTMKTKHAMATAIALANSAKR